MTGGQQGLESHAGDLLSPVCWLTAMPYNFWVETHSWENTDAVCCALCDQPFDPLPVMTALHDGIYPLGDLCSFCLLDTTEAAERLRQRAGMIRAHARKAAEGLSGLDLVKALEMAQARAYRWVELACRVEKLDAWPRGVKGV